VSALPQIEASPVLTGTAYVGDAPLDEGTIVLHHLADGSQGEVDSVRVDDNGGFSFRLPRVPDPQRNDIFFASLRHDGVLYFGPAINTAVQLDSAYEIHAYDTLLAPAEGMAVAMQSRSLFLEPDGEAWRATDLFQVRNDEARTAVARENGRTWSYPLPAEAVDVAVGEGDLSFDAATYENGELVVRAALPPGERLFVVRYGLESPFVSIPTPGVSETLDILIREPASDVEVQGLALTDRVELEPGSTYRRYTGEDFNAPFVEVVEAESSRPPPMRWFAVVLALILTVSGLFAVRAARAPASAPAAGGRPDLLMQVARLDEEYHGRDAPTAAERREYERRRAQLMRQVRSGR
jgi:hypothetical protein